MGLDMYVRRIKGGAELECLADDVAPNFAKVGEEYQREGDFWYWRKHADLHGWMHKLHLEKGGECDAAEFNCVPVRLRAEDLDALERDLNERALPKTTGFFFGESDEGDLADTREFIGAARQALSEGDALFYDSWW